MEVIRMEFPQSAPRKLNHRGAQSAKLLEQSLRCRKKLAIGNNARDHSKPLRLGGANLPAGKNQVGRRAKTNQLRQSNQGDRRKAAQLNLRLAELRRLRRYDEIAKRGKFHAAAKAVAVNHGDFHAIRVRKTAEYSMNRGQHFPDAPGDMVGYVSAGGKRLGPRALKHQEIALGQNALQRRIQRPHHWNIENIQRRTIQRDPRGALFNFCLDRFAHSPS